jgi:hypothetical protein
MQVAGTQSWGIGCDEPRLPLLALVRDAAGLDAAADPPVARLEPAVAAAGEAAPEAAAAQWTEPRYFDVEAWRSDLALVVADLA